MHVKDTIAIMHTQLHKTKGGKMLTTAQSKWDMYSLNFSGHLKVFTKNFQKIIFPKISSLS